MIKLYIVVMQKESQDMW